VTRRLQRLDPLLEIFKQDCLDFLADAGFELLPDIERKLKPSQNIYMQL